MGKGSSAPSSQTVEQTNLPEYVRPQFERLLSRAESQSLEPYTPYGGQRVAQPTAEQGVAYDMVRDIATSGVAGLPEATGVVAQNIGQGQQIAQSATPFQFDANRFQQQQVDPFSDFQQFQADQYQFDPTQQFTGQNVGQYMSPYMQQVLDVQKDQARRQFGEQAAGRAAQAVQAGAFGGSRQAVQESLAERDLLDRMADIQATGQQQAFQSAQQAFEADRAARFGREQAQASELGRVQGIGTQEAARTQAAQAAELARTQGISVDEAARVQAAQQAQEQAQAAEDASARAQQLEALGFTSQQAQQMVGFGETARAADIQGAQLLEAVGKTLQGQEQQGLDIAYQDYLRQQAYPEQQLQQFSSILRGVPVQPSVTQTAYAPYNPAQQALGAGLTGIGLYRGLQG